MLDNEIKTTFRYDPTTGDFFRGDKKVGFRNTILGYIMVSTGRTTRLYGHRLAFFLMTGSWPDRVDHINGDGFDNRWENLRNSTARQNRYNSGKARCGSLSGVKGVCWSCQKNKWRAVITHPGGKQKHLGFYADISSASAAYQAAAKELHGAFYHAG